MDETEARAVRCASAWTSCEEPGVHTVAEASTREHPREATIVEQARVMPKCANIAPWQMRCIQGHIAASLQSDIRIADLAGIVGCSSYRISASSRSTLAARRINTSYAGASSVLNAFC
jgi:hypothetical protein